MHISRSNKIHRIIQDRKKKETHAVSAHIQSYIKLRQTELGQTHQFCQQPLLRGCGDDSGNTSPALLRCTFESQGGSFPAVEIERWRGVQSLPLEKLQSRTWCPLSDLKASILVQLRQKYYWAYSMAKMGSFWDSIWNFQVAKWVNLRALLISSGSLMAWYRGLRPRAWLQETILTLTMTSAHSTVGLLVLSILPPVLQPRSWVKD